jgi:hypothetical protein
MKIEFFCFFSGGGGQSPDTDCETEPPSDCDRPPIDHILYKMEQLNK